MTPSLEELSAWLIEKGDALAETREKLSEIQDQHPVLKEMAIIRVMKRDGISSSAAKDVVKTDLEYMEHCVARRLAGGQVCRAEAEYEVAKAKLTQASLITPSVIELQTKIKKLELDLKIQKQERQTAENGRTEANRMLRDRIHDVDALTQRNRRFWAMVDLVTPRPLEVYDAWQASIAHRASAIPGLENARGPHELPGDLCAAQIGGG